MNIKVAFPQFYTALKQAKKFAAKRGCMAITEYARLTASATGTYIETTDNDMACRIQLYDVDVIEEGSVLLDITMLLGTYTAKSCTHMTIVNNTETVEFIEPDGTTIYMKFADIDLYPELLFPVCGPGYDIESGKLKTLIPILSKHMSGDAIKPVFNCMYVKTHEHRLIAAATDSRRLVAAFLNDTDIVFDHLLPRQFVQAVASVLPKNATVTIYPYEYETTPRILIQWNEVTCVTRCVDGMYPNIFQVIPTGQKYSYYLSRKPVLAGLTRAKVFANSPSYKTILTFENNVLSMETNGDAGSCDMSFPVNVSVCPEDSIGLCIGANIVYLQDALAAITTDTFHMICASEISPIVIEPDYGFITDKDILMKFIIMPIQIKHEPREAAIVVTQGSV